MTWAWWFLAVWLTCSVLLCGWLCLTDDEPPEERETRLGIERAGREAAKGRHPAGKAQQVYDQEWDIHIPPSREVRDHGQGKSVADTADADLIRIHIENMWNMPAAQERRTT